MYAEAEGLLDLFFALVNRQVQLVEARVRPGEGALPLRDRLDRKRSKAAVVTLFDGKRPIFSHPLPMHRFRGDVYIKGTATRREGGREGGKGGARGDAIASMNNTREITGCRPPWQRETIQGKSGVEGGFVRGGGSSSSFPRPTIPQNKARTLNPQQPHP